MSTVEVRRIGADEVRAFVVSEHVPFLESLDEDDVGRVMAPVEPERSWAGVDDGRFVATAGILTRDVTVPGPPVGPCPTVAMAGVTAVGVHPTHRRQGLLRRLMTAMLDDARDRGEPLAGLFASESSIYGRFGFGTATVSTTLAIDRRRSQFAFPAPALRLRVAGAEEAGNVLPALFERLRTGRAGEVDRNRSTWKNILAAPRPGSAGAGGARHWAIADDGYVAYRARAAPQDGRAADGRMVVEVADLFGATPEVEAALWRFVLDIDLVEKVVAPVRPVDEPVRWRLVGPRQLQTQAVTDRLWLRPLDVPQALAARRSTVSGAVVIDVVGSAEGPVADADRDRVLGPWSIESGPEGTDVGRPRSGAGSDLRLGIAELGALYLGGVSATTLAGAGRIEADRPGALAAADRVFGAATAPLTSTDF